jgi:hypothetical protein
MFNGWKTHTCGIGEPLTHSFGIGGEPKTCNIDEHLTWGFVISKP